MSVTKILKMNNQDNSTTRILLMDLPSPDVQFANQEGTIVLAFDDALLYAPDRWNFGRDGEEVSHVYRAQAKAFALIRDQIDLLRKIAELRAEASAEPDETPANLRGGEFNELFNQLTKVLREGGKLIEF